MSIKPRYKTKQISVGGVLVGGDAPISVQSMTFTKTHDIKATKEQIDRLQLAGADMVRLAVLTKEDALALKEIKKQTNLPLIADIHFKYSLALIAAESVDCIRINPGNIGNKDRIKQVANACKQRGIPIRIGVNAGSLEKIFEQKYGATKEGMINSALYNIKLLEDFDFFDIKVSLKASDVIRTMEAYRGLRPLVPYAFHLGVTEAGTLYHSMVKSSMALGNLLIEGIGDTIRCSITGELEEEIKLAKSILKYSGRQKDGITLVSCPTCGRIEADLLKAIKVVEKKLEHIKVPLQISVMGCAVNALGEAKHSDIAIAFGNKSGKIIKDNKVIATLSEDKIVDAFIEEVQKLAKQKQEEANLGK